MSSVAASVRQVSANNGYYIPIAALAYRGVLAYNPTTGAASTFSTASWAATTSVSSCLDAAGAGLLKDMGKTVISAGRTFRKVQLVTSTASTFGVGGTSPATWPNTEYYTGYIELGFDGTGVPPKFATFGR